MARARSRTPITAYAGEVRCAPTRSTAPPQAHCSVWCECSARLRPGCQTREMMVSAHSNRGRCQ
eukprot:4195783-Prymnesium_polylepis.1